MTRARIIPFLLFKAGRLVKTTRFSEPRYVGDPINAVRIFNEKEVDELVLLDIGATQANVAPDYALINDIATEAFMPVGYGGGIQSLTQIEALFKAGVEKVCLNSILYENPEIVREAAQTYGSQSVVVAIDVKRDFMGRYRLYSNGGRTRQKIDPFDHLDRLQQLGAGEIVLNSIDRDGTMIGYDLQLVKKVANRMSVPIVSVGGAGTADHLKQALGAGASAAGAGSMFVFHGRHKAVLISYTDPADISQ
jgi:cyclase